VTLQDLGNIGEFVGAVGVIASLVYLATQIRQNTRAVRSSAEQEVLGDMSMSAFIDLISGDSDTASLYELGLADSRDLSRVERLRFSLLLTRFFYGFSRMYNLHRDGNLDPESWEAQKEILRWVIKQPGVKRWWPNARSQIPSSFADFVEREMG
jgi:hypothetical protein